VKREGVNKLVLLKLEVGEYELLVYAHNCLSFLDNGKQISSFDVSFSIDFNFIRWMKHTDDLITKYVNLQIGNDIFKTPLDPFHPS
jgi:hypothetical protein